MPRSTWLDAASSCSGASDTSFDNTGEYLFKHALVCDVTYETVLLSERPLLHARAAAWLESAAGERVAEYREMIAGHLRAAGEPTRAAEHLWRAGQTLLATGTPAAAARSLGTAVQLWDSAGEVPPVEALLLLAEASLRVDDMAAAEAALDRAGRACGDTIRTEPTCCTCGAGWPSLRGQSDLERSLLEQALPLAEEAGGESLAKTLTGLAWCDAQSGRLAEAERHAQRAFEIADDLGDVGGTCRALAVLAMVASERGDLEASQRIVERAARHRREHAGTSTSRRRRARNLGTTIHLRGDAEGNARALPRRHRPLPARHRAPSPARRRPGQRSGRC